MILKKKLVYDYIKQAQGDSSVKTNAAMGTRLEKTTKRDLAKQAQGPPL